MNEKPSPEFVVVPIEKISEQTLTGLIEEFILREGTDYGVREFTLLEKHEQIKKQLAMGTCLIVFDINEQTASIIRKEQLSE